MITLDLSNNTDLTFLDCGYSDLTNLNISNNTILERLNYPNNSLSSLNLKNNIKLKNIDCSKNQITNLDLTSNTELKGLNSSDNQLTHLDLSNNTELRDLKCSNNPLVNLDLSNNEGLVFLYMNNTLLTNLDLSLNPNLALLHCRKNALLNYINLKNGNNDNFNLIRQVSFENVPSLSVVCVDDINSELVAEIKEDVGDFVYFASYCDVTPYHNNKISGSVKVDLLGNGCDSLGLPLHNIMIQADNGTEKFTAFIHENGGYLIYTNEGNFVTSLSTSLPSYFTINPSSQTSNFTGWGNADTVNFCIEANQIVSDLNITLLPISQARPGFTTSYQLVYNNIGSTQLSGMITMNFDSTKLRFLSAGETIASYTGNSLSFDYTDLNPFETRLINLEFNILRPPTVVNDDTLTFTATIDPTTEDFTPDNNIFTLEQMVVGSFDPNDITVLEGEQILLNDVDNYLHYVIRFQNTGTASAINIVVKNKLDSLLDWSTFQLESASHYNRIAIKNESDIEFIFENINLLDSTTNEEKSHGFIAYKIKPKGNISPGNIIPNKANIFFDFNEAVETNTVTTEILNLYSVDKTTRNNFSVYPIPTKNILNVRASKEIQKIEIFNKLGQLVQENSKQYKIDMSNLKPGIYLVKVRGENGNFEIKKVIKE